MNTEMLSITNSKTTLGRAARRAALVVALTTGTVATAITVGQEAAQASAFSCTGYGIGFSWGYPSQFCAQTDGSGTWVASAGAGYSTLIAWAGWLDNTRVEVQFINDQGQVYWSAISGQQNGGSAVGAWKWTLNSNMQPGIVKYTLLSNGAYIASVEQRIA